MMLQHHNQQAKEMEAPHLNHHQQGRVQKIQTQQAKQHSLDQGEELLDLHKLEVVNVQQMQRQKGGRKS